MAMSNLSRNHQERVVLIHGLAARPWMLGLLASRLRAEGFATESFFYRSIRASIPKIAERFLQRLRQLDADTETARIHIVCHSMGGIITRQALLNETPRKLGRVVMLAPPNHGSLTAAFWGPLVKPICPAAQQLSSRPGSYVQTLPEPTDGEWAILAAKYDRVVAVNSTRLQRPHRHQVIPTGHLRLLIRRDTAQLAARFLKTGQFLEDHTPQHDSQPANAAR